MDNYLPLTEYSTKYKVSISTLRRKIKSRDIRFRLDQGKYFILDQELQRPSLKDVEVTGPSQKDERAQSIAEPESFSTVLSNHQQAGEPVFTAANKLLSELKKAYSLILQEKEEQILNLREEVTDLKTLVRVLESENERLKRF
jgi:hypothetical protein